MLSVRSAKDRKRHTTRRASPCCEYPQEKRGAARTSTIAKLPAREDTNDRSASRCPFRQIRMGTTTRRSRRQKLEASPPHSHVLHGSARRRLTSRWPRSKASTYGSQDSADKSTSSSSSALSPDHRL